MLCPQTVAGLARSLKQVTFAFGRQYTVLSVSFDPTDTPQAAAEIRGRALAELGQPPDSDGWHFLTGNQASIRALTTAVGFAYRSDPRTHQYFHAAGIMLLTPDGRFDLPDFCGPIITGEWR
jgi:protein SCO1/2